MNSELFKIISAKESKEAQANKRSSTKIIKSNISKKITFENLISHLDINLKPALCFNLNDLSIFNNLDIGREIFIEKEDLKLKIQSLGEYGK